MLETTEDNIEQMILAADFLECPVILDALMLDITDDLENQMKDLEMTPKCVVLKYLRLYAVLRGQEFDQDEDDLDDSPTTTQLSFCNAGSKESFVREEFPISIKFLVASHLKLVLNEYALVQLEENHIHELLSSDDLRITEKEVLAVIKRWIYHDFEERKESWVKLLSCLRVDYSLSVSQSNHPLPTENLNLLNPCRWTWSWTSSRAIARPTVTA